MFHYDSASLMCDQTPLAEIARRSGTPVYVYSAETIRTNFRAYDESFGLTPHTICYAVKANANLAILGLLAHEGSGFDIVSAGELFRVLKAGGDAGQVVFSGVGKTAEEIEYALASGIHSFNCESEAELTLLDAMAGRAGRKATFSLRVNPDVGAETHPYISTGMREHKFGIDIAEAPAVYERAARLRNLEADGVSCHIGSQILDTSPVMDAADRVLDLVGRLRTSGLAIRQVDFGGGLGVAYRPEDETPAIREFVGRLREKVEGRGLEVKVEPGRSIVGNAGVLLTRVLYRKKTAAKEFVVVDAAMNDLLRPSLYQAYHDILPVRKTGLGTMTADVVGPVCESGDFLARDRQMAEVMPGDLLAVCTAGAYGFVLSSNYNARPRPAEVLVEGATWRIVRTRETLADLIRGECV